MPSSLEQCHENGPQIIYDVPKLYEHVQGDYVGKNARKEIPVSA